MSKPKPDPTPEELDARGHEIKPRILRNLPPGPSRYHGVSWNRTRHRWQVSITVGQTSFFIGEFYRDLPLLWKEVDENGQRKPEYNNGERVAAKAYDNAAWWLQDFRRNKLKLNFAEDEPAPMLERVGKVRRELLLAKPPLPRYETAIDFVAPDDVRVLALYRP